MTPFWTMALSGVAAIAGFGAAVLLYRASLPMPHDKISWKGQTPFELSFRTRAHRAAFAGLVLATLAVGCSLAVATGVYVSGSN
jgi:hypothetical protein